MPRVTMAFVMLIGLAGMTGCRSETANTQEFATALDVLKSGLEAWKSGSKPASLNTGANPLDFRDSDWQAGTKLVEYKILKVGGEDEGETLCNVTLKLDVRGKMVDRSVSYRVILTPKRSVSRNPQSR